MIWPSNTVAGISLTYDGTRPVHLERVVPLLNELGITATFFAYAPNLVDSLDGWRKAVSAGHELGNAFLYGAADTDGLAPEWPEETYEIEFREAQELIGCIARVESFAYPYVRTSWSEDGIPIVERVVSETVVKLNHEILEPYAKQFPFVRTPLDGFNAVGESEAKCFCADNMDAESLCVLSHLGISKGAWAVLVFSGLADTPFDAEAHEKFVRWLAKKRDQAFVAPFARISRLFKEPADVKLY